MSNSRINSLIKETTWFAIGNFGSKILSLLLVPLYTNILSTKEYGAVDIVSTTISLAIPVLTLSLQDAAFRYAMEKGVQKRSVISDCMLITAVSPIVLLLLFPIADRYVPVLTTYWWYFVVIYALNSISSVLSCYLKGIGKSRIFATQGIVYTFFFLLSNVILLLFMQQGVQGYLFSLMIAHMVSCLYMIIVGNVLRDISLRYVDIQLLKDMLRYSLPLIPASIAWWIMTSIDRYMLFYMCGTDANGLYSVAHKFPTMISVVMNFFVNAWHITAVRNKDDTDIGEFTSRIFEMLFCVGMVIGFLMILISKELGRLFFANDFFAAWTITPLLSVSTIFSTLSLFLGAQFTASKRSDLHLKSNMISMTANVVLNYVLIMQTGIDGAAYGTMISYFIVLVYRMIKTKELMQIMIDKCKLYTMCCLMMIAATLTAVEIPGYHAITIMFLLVGLLAYKIEMKKIIIEVMRKIIKI